jgi:hypothetical protein
MYKLEFTLKQHTPIIHFQHEQDGATLRATEVKPKLDRFIIEKLTGQFGNNAFELFKANPLWKNWLIGNGEHPALDYKLKIESDGEILNSKIEKNYPNYLGNMGKTPDNKGFVINQSTFVSIFVINYDLKEKITQYFSLFLSRTNFGNRTSKGFGCFSLFDNSETNFEKELLENFGTVFKYIWKNSTVDLVEDNKYLFRKIQDEYKVLKAGDSRSKKDSKLRQYVNKLPVPLEWEKPVIQTDIQSFTPNRLNINWKNKNFYYVRALLGLADHFEFIQQKVTVHFTPLDKNFERFASPLIFKVFDKNLYLTVNNNHNLNQIRRKEIKITYKQNERDVKGVENTLKIPDIDFNINEFLNDALKNTSWKKL